MSRAHALFHRSLSLWMSIHLSTSTLSCTYLLRSVLNLSHQLLALESVTVAVLVVITVAQIISSFVMCLSLCHDMTHFRCPLIALIAGTNALQEQAHSLAIAYINYLYRNSVGISFFEITIIDRKFVEKIVIVVLLITAMYHFNDSDKHLTDGCDEMISGS
ncbi:unnamed protein product [Litomosoides sigmodontis]|uniref:Uncharacterized protein n=1 Tax=Litomosoides sigmodontis TaxID=42156 RepID=A0A3P6U7T0_LITSI|nr:unnamed protein product [Litomosoides sigmodontis]